MHAVPNQAISRAQASEASKYHSLEAFQHAVIGVAVLDLEGRVVDCNTAFASSLGYTPQETCQLEALALVHPADREQRNRMMDSMSAGELPAFVIESRYIRSDTSELWACDSVSLLRDHQNQPQCILIVSEDLSRLKRAESLLLQSQGLITMGRLSASIAHEINNPLESVTNLLFLIANSTEMDDMRYYAHLADEELARVTRITMQTLRFYRPQSAPAPVHLTEVIESVLALFEGRIRRDEVKVIKNYQPATPALLAYSSELRQVFVNLVGNSLDAMDTKQAKGSLHIAVRASRSWSGGSAPGVRVTVCDAGTGIPKAMLTKVFEPFVSTKEHTGHGLGLWITKDIVRRHGGDLHVRSRETGPKQGTCMSVFLPTVVEQADTNAA